MRLETILDAMEGAREQYTYGKHDDFEKRLRQYHAFRDRILRMDAEKDYAEACIIEDWHTIKQLEKRIAEPEAEVQRLTDGVRDIAMGE